MGYEHAVGHMIKSYNAWLAASTQAKQIECVDLFVWKSDSSQGPSVLRLDIGTINLFCLDDGIRKILDLLIRGSLLMRDI